MRRTKIAGVFGMRASAVNGRTGFVCSEQQTDADQAGTKRRRSDKCSRMTA